MTLTIESSYQNSSNSNHINQTFYLKKYYITLKDIYNKYNTSCCRDEGRYSQFFDPLELFDVRWQFEYLFGTAVDDIP